MLQFDEENKYKYTLALCLMCFLIHLVAKSWWHKMGKFGFSYPDKIKRHVSGVLNHSA